MAVTQDDVTAAFNKRESARQARDQASQELENTPLEEAETRQQLTAKIRRLDKNVSDADKDYVRISTAFSKDNAATKPKTPTPLNPAQAATEAEKDRNQAQGAGRVTDEQRIANERAAAAAADRARGNPIQQQNAATNQQNANTNTGRAVEAQRHNLQTEQDTIIKNQIEALKSQGILIKDIRGQISQEAQESVRAQNDAEKNQIEAGGKLISAEVTRNTNQGQLQQQRAQFLQSFLTTAMPKVAEMMMNTPKGSKTAQNFMMTFMAMANQAYTNLGLDKDIPGINPNSPEARAMRAFAGRPVNSKPPTMPSAEQITWRTTKVMSGIGYPVVGSQMPVGPAALMLPDMPEGTNGTGIDPMRSAAQSEAGRALEQKYRTPAIQAIEAKQKSGQPLTPEETAQLQTAKTGYETELKTLAKSNTVQQGQQQPGTQASVAAKDAVRAVLISGDPDSKLGLMSLAITGMEAKKLGKPLSEAQTAALANLDPEDVAIIQQNMTPEVRSILVAHGNGQSISPDQIKTVENALTLTTNAVKTRAAKIPVINSAPPSILQPGQQSPEQAARAAAASAPGPEPGFPGKIINPQSPTTPINANTVNQMQKQTAADRFKQNEQELATPTGNPALDQEMKKIDQEQRNFFATQQGDNFYWGKSLREQAQARLNGNTDTGMVDEKPWEHATPEQRAAGRKTDTTPVPFSGGNQQQRMIFDSTLGENTSPPTDEDRRRLQRMANDPNLGINLQNPFSTRPEDTIYDGGVGMNPRSSSGQIPDFTKMFGNVQENIQAPITTRLASKDWSAMDIPIFDPTFDFNTPDDEDEDKKGLFSFAGWDY